LGAIVGLAGSGRLNGELELYGRQHPAGRFDAENEPNACAHTDVSAEAEPITNEEKRTASGNTSTDSLGMRLVMMSRFIAFTWLIGGPGRWQNDAAPEYNER
jgi:hypothetical protein